MHLIKAVKRWGAEVPIWMWYHHISYLMSCSSHYLPYVNFSFNNTQDDCLVLLFRGPHKRPDLCPSHTCLILIQNSCPLVTDNPSHLTYMAHQELAIGVQDGGGKAPQKHSPCRDGLYHRMNWILSLFTLSCSYFRVRVYRSKHSL